MRWDPLQMYTTWKTLLGKIRLTNIEGRRSANDVNRNNQGRETIYIRQAFEQFERILDQISSNRK